MKHVSLAVLEEKIIKPGFEQRLMPLLKFRGAVTLGRVHRLWNLMVSAMEHEATSADITQRLVMNPAYSHLCGPENRVALSTIRSFAGRLKATPQVLGEMPHLSEYIDYLLPWWRSPFHLTPLRPPPEKFVAAARGKSLGWAVKEYGVDHRIAHRWFAECGFEPVHGLVLPVPPNWANIAPKHTNAVLARRFGVSMRTIARWRSETGVICLAPRASPAGRSEIVYPFIIHDGGKPEHELLKMVNKAVPQHLDPESRADICQDLIVGILCGDFPKEDLKLPAKEMGRKLSKMFPSKYGAEVSLDAPLGHDSEFSLMDVLADEGRDWA